MTTYEDARWESRLPYFENNETWSLVDFLNWSIVFANNFGNKQDEHLLYKICLEKLRLNPQLLKSCSSELVENLVSDCINSFEVCFFCFEIVANARMSPKLLWMSLENAFCCSLFINSRECIG